MLKFKGIRNSNNLILSVVNVFMSTMFFALCGIVAFSLFIFASLTIECDVVGVSMQPTLNKHGGNKCDIVYVNTVNDDYQYGDIIVIDTETDAIIKRIVGLPGDILDIVRCDDGFFRLERNGQIIEEDYIKINNSINIETYFQNGMNSSASEFNNLRIRRPDLFNEYGQLVVGEDSLFAMGDNRKDSQDSTYYGTFKFSAVRGVVEEIRYYGESELEFYLQFVGSGKFIKALLNLIFV